MIFRRKYPMIQFDSNGSFSFSYRHQVNLLNQPKKHAISRPIDFRLEFYRRTHYVFITCSEIRKKKSKICIQFFNTVNTRQQRLQLGLSITIHLDYKPNEFDSVYTFLIVFLFCVRQWLHWRHWTRWLPARIRLQR